MTMMKVLAQVCEIDLPSDLINSHRMHEYDHQLAHRVNRFCKAIRVIILGESQT